MQSKCYSNADCPNDKVCNPDSGKCHNKAPECKSDTDCLSNEVCDTANEACVLNKSECTSDTDCDTSQKCIDDICQVEVLLCPVGMIAIDNLFCIDMYEASRPDATESTGGTDDSRAMSVSGVIPWKVKDNATAEAACNASKKSLCTSNEWFRACAGESENVYAYGNAYQSATCNGIDAFCRCDSCTDLDMCSYPGCYRECGAAFRLMPTGSFTGCTNEYGVFDMNGNLWEHIKSGSDKTVRGGAYNCSDSAKLHQCSYIPGNWTPSARGFRCCSPGTAAVVKDSDANLKDAVLP